jgi:competence protein ComEC
MKLRINWIYGIPLAISLSILVYFNLPSEPKLNYYYILYYSLFISIIAFRHKIVAIYLTALLIGFIACVIRTQTVYAPTIHHKLENIWINGQISEIQLAERGGRITLTNLFVRELSKKQTHKKIKIISNSSLEQFTVGDKVVFMGTLMAPAAPMVPAGFDYQRFAYYQQIGGTGFALSKIILKSKPPLEAHFIEKIRQKIIARINHTMPQPAASIASGMLVGDSSYLKQKVYQQVKAVGIAHVIAISGMHMVVIVGIIFLSTRQLCTYSQFLSINYNLKKLSAIWAIIGSFFYLILAGNPVSAQRAYLMSTMILLSVLFDRYNNPLNSMAIACTIILLITPEALLNPSLQMSVASCFGLIMAYDQLQKLLPDHNDNNLFLRIMRYGFNVAASTFIAGLFTAPLIIYHFHNFPTYTILANLLAIPLTDMILMPLGLLGLLLMPLQLEQLPLALMKIGIDLMLWLVVKISILPQANVFIPHLPIYLVAAFIVGIIAIFVPKNWLRLGGFGILTLSCYAAFKTKMPDLVVSGDGDLFAVLHKQRYYFSSLRHRKFTRQVWQEFLGESNPQSIKSAQIENCTAVECLVGDKILISFQPDNTMCDKYQLIINLAEQPLFCSDSKIINRIYLFENGTSFIYLRENDFSIDFAIDPLVARPWKNNSAQYVSK